jgi:hypothetical protein
VEANNYDRTINQTDKRETHRTTIKKQKKKSKMYIMKMLVYIGSYQQTFSFLKQHNIYVC